MRSKIIAGFLLIGFLSVSFPVFAGYTAGNYPLSSKIDIVNVNLATANTVYGVTLEAGASSDLQIGSSQGTIKFIDPSASTYTITRECWTIPVNTVWKPIYGISYVDDKVLYFWSGTAASTVEVIYTYR